MIYDLCITYYSYLLFFTAIINRDRPFTKLEKNLLEASAAIREKPNWETKYTNPQIAQKWKSELPGTWTDGEFQFLMDELTYYKLLQHGAIKVFCISKLSFVSCFFFLHTLW
jgi:hypothetical protein